MMSASRKSVLRDRYGPWAVVTGASSGIGRAIAIELAAAGLHIITVGRRREELDLLAARLGESSSADVRIVVADLATFRGREIVEEAAADVDVGLLVAAAGFGSSGPFLDADLASDLEMIDVNCGALLSQSLHFGRRFASRGRGGIVLMASLVGYQGVPYAATYAATKAFVQSLAEALAFELRPQGVDVPASAPGPVRSGFERRANMRMNAAIGPETVARETLAALGRKAVVVPGLLSKILTYSLAPLPRARRTRIMARVMRGMTEHQQEIVGKG